MTDVKRLPALVSLQHLSFQFANGETLLADVNLSIDQTPTGIVGRKVDLVSHRAIERSSNWIRRKAILETAEPYFASR